MGRRLFAAAHRLGFRLLTWRRRIWRDPEVPGSMPMTSVDDGRSRIRRALRSIPRRPQVEHPPVAAARWALPELRLRDLGKHAQRAARHDGKIVRLASAYSGGAVASSCQKPVRASATAFC